MRLATFLAPGHDEPIAGEVIEERVVAYADRRRAWVNGELRQDANTSGSGTSSAVVIHGPSRTT